MARIFKIPFGAQGDTEQVPEAPQGDGSVSLTQGFGYDYEREYEDPAAKDIRREVMNGLFHDVTEAIGDIQLSGIAKWDAAAAPYPAGAVVWHNDNAWRSAVGNNSSEPAEGADWSAVVTQDDSRLSDAREWTADTVSLAEAEAGTATTRRAWTAQRVRQAITSQFATAPEAQALESLTKILTPGRLDDAFKGGNQFFPSSTDQGHYQRLPGGLLLQFGRMDSTPSGITTYTLPIAFPNRGVSIQASFLVPAQGNIYIQLSGNTQFRVQNTYTSPQSFYWFAIGY